MLYINALYTFKKRDFFYLPAKRPLYRGLGKPFLNPDGERQTFEALAQNA
jgi:hypothetical protein